MADGPCIRPNPRLMRVKRGCPVSTKIRNNMDDVEKTTKKRCGLCHRVGHTQRTCTALDGHLSTSGNIK
ncbi:hypothetical protein Ahy_B06g084174 [Arachis hypogaea]|uniref:Uncharacterized protein n=1 Tax=Arachis hypogaea TaxID=3818 RepID=A0A444YRA1_ARAHY|nr:hypothetical protein Ahy_B06g084174 [Arachis hypogaea]